MAKASEGPVTCVQVGCPILGEQLPHEARRTYRISRTPSGSTILLLMGLAIQAAYARSPEARKARHLERGKKYFGREEYQYALFECRNLLQMEETNLQAIRWPRLFGMASSSTGESENA